MSRRRRDNIVYTYECTITGEKFKTTAKAPNPNELISVKAYYELHSDNDDRPEIIKKKLAVEESLMPAAETVNELSEDEDLDESDTTSEE